MGRRVLKKQPNSRMCLVCGLENTCGLKAAFFEVDGQQLVARFEPREEHQGYPGRLHGGIASAILDETMGRTILIHHEHELWGVTLDLHVRFRQAIPLDRPVRVVARLTDNGRRQFQTSGYILAPDGGVAAEGEGRYLKMSLDKIADFDVEREQWRVVASDDDPLELEV